MIVNEVKQGVNSTMILGPPDSLDQLKLISVGIGSSQCAIDAENRH